MIRPNWLRWVAWFLFFVEQSIPIASMIWIAWTILYLIGRPFWWGLLESLGVMYVVYFVCKIVAAVTTRQWRAL